MESNSEATGEGASMARKRHAAALDIAGAGLFWAWVDCTQLTPALFSPFDAPAHFFPLAFLCAILASTVSLAACAARPSLFSFISRRSRWMPGVGAVAAIATAALAASSAWSEAALLVLASAANGIVNGIGVIAWGQRYAVHGARSAIVLAPASFAAAAALCIVAHAAVQPYILPVAAALMPALSFAVLHRARRESPSIDSVAEGGFESEPEGGAPDRAESGDGAPRGRRLDDGDRREIRPLRRHALLRSFGISAQMALAFVVFGLACGFMQYESVFAGKAGLADASLSLLAVRGGTAVVLVAAAFAAPRKTSAVYRFGMAVIIAGFMAAPFFIEDGSPTIVSAVITMVGYTALDAMTWTLLAEVSFYRSRRPEAVIGLGRACVHGGIAAGMACGLAVSLSNVTPSQGLVITTSVGYLLVIAVILLLSDNAGIWSLLKHGTLAEGEGDSDGQAEAAEAGPDGTSEAASVQEAEGPREPREQDMGLAIERLSSHYGLTAREREVLELFSAGRSTPFIADAFCISTSTVKSHVRHIYEKCDVHSRDDLIDLLHAMEK